jgi:hypothetical protein
MPGTATYVYCIVHAARVPRTLRVPAGLPGATRPVAIPAARSLWLIGADVPLGIYGSGALEPRLRDVDWVGSVAVAHEAVVEHFVRQSAATVVPMKLFTMFSSQERAVDDVRARRRAIQTILKRIAGCEEWGVRMIRTAAVSAPAGGQPEPATGIAFLASKKDARDRAREAMLTRSAAVERAFSALAAIARDARRRDDAPDGAAPPLLDAAFLVPVAHRARFKAAVKRLAAEAQNAGAVTTLTGPWPAYYFVQIETAA